MEPTAKQSNGSERAQHVAQRGRSARIAARATTLACIVALGCAADSQHGEAVTADSQELRMTIGKEGGELIGKEGTALAGVHLTVPAGALAKPTEIAIKPASDGVPLPVT